MLLNCSLSVLFFKRGTWGEKLVPEKSTTYFMQNVKQKFIGWSPERHIREFKFIIAYSKNVSNLLKNYVKNSL